MMNKKIPKFNSQESDSKTRVLRPQTGDYVKLVKPPSNDTVDELANAIRKTWIAERSNGQ